MNKYEQIDECVLVKSLFSDIVSVAHNIGHRSMQSVDTHRIE